MMKVLLGRYITEFLLYHEWRSKVHFGYIHTDGDALLCSGKDGLLRFLTQLLHGPEFWAMARHSFEPLEIFFEAHSSLLAELLTLKNILLFSLHGLWILSPVLWMYVLRFYGSGKVCLTLVFVFVLNSVILINYFSF